MAAAQVLEPKAGECILDLCAAPGGKTTHIAGKMKGKGLLVSNEIVSDRAKILAQNVERMGIANTVVCNESPQRLAEFFPEFFDRILVDAPCSGEGMFRKEDVAVEMWSPENVEMCAQRQLDILDQAADMLKEGGVLVYSTCTFSPKEDEGVISEFIKTHEDFYIERSEYARFFSPGEGRFTEAPVAGIEDTMRLWPHKLKGEGHFIARLRKTGECVGGRPQCGETEIDSGIIQNETVSESRQSAKITAEVKHKNAANSAGKNNIKRSAAEEISINRCREFLKKELGMTNHTLDKLESSGNYTMFGDRIYLAPKELTTLKGLKIVRAGLQLGTDKKNRFEPAHALALYLSKDDVGRCYDMTDDEAIKYIKGETFACSPDLKGWTLLCIDGYSIGFGKAGGGIMKNHYPKGLRKELNQVSLCQNG